LIHPVVPGEFGSSIEFYSTFSERRTVYTPVDPRDTTTTYDHLRKKVVGGERRKRKVKDRGRKGWRTDTKASGIIRSTGHSIGVKEEIRPIKFRSTRRKTTRPGKREEETGRPWRNTKSNCRGASKKAVIETLIAVLWTSAYTTAHRERDLSTRSTASSVITHS